MKYNKSEIMKSAWVKFQNVGKNIYGKNKRTFADCLREAWAVAKVRVANAEKKASELSELSANKKDFSGKASFEGYFFKLWENYGKRRIYIGDRGAYIDLNDGNKIRTKNSDITEAAEKFLAAYNI